MQLEGPGSAEQKSPDSDSDSGQGSCETASPRLLLAGTAARGDGGQLRGRELGLRAVVFNSPFLQIFKKLRLTDLYESKTPSFVA